MKKIIQTTVLLVLSLTLNAQIKVYSGGYACFGSTSYTPNKPIDVVGSGGIQISQTADSSTSNEIYFQDNGQIRSFDNAHRIVFDRGSNILDLREYGNIVFSPGAGSAGVRTQRIVFTSAGDANITSLSNGYQINGKYVLQQKNIGTCIFVGSQAGNNNTAAGTTAVGSSALFTNTNQPHNNAFGAFALYSNNTGYYNLAVGDSSLYKNTSGTGNVAVGSKTLLANQAGNNNTAAGVECLAANTSGSTNTGLGSAALSRNTIGSSNTGVGYEALISVTTAGANTAVGYEALYSNTGDHNVAVGYVAGSSYAGGNNNTFVGCYADASGTYTNCAAFGNSASVLGNDHIVIGNSTVTQIGGYQAWTNLSDGRFKTNVIENVKGLAFIKKLRPVTYNLDTKAVNDFITQNMPDSVKIMRKQGLDFTASKAIIHSGFIAQEVEQASQQVGFANSIVNAPTNSTEPYSLSYAEIVVPLVKAVQELAGKTDSLSTITHKQDSLINVLQNQINSCCNSGATQRTTNQSIGSSNQIIISGEDNGSLTGAMLYQNNPNPFSQTTVVKCFIPDASKTASLLVFDMNGSLKKTLTINDKGTVNTTINGNQLVPGMYYYTLLIDGQEIDTKKMILTE